MSSEKEKINKQHRYPWAVIETAIQLYYQKNTTFRSVSERLLSHGVFVSHKTIYEWTNKFSTNVEQKTRRRNGTYEIEESYVKCNGEFFYMYRAHDRQNTTLSVFLRATKSLTAAKSFFNKTLTLFA